jgi:hypothetical protein
MTGLLLAVVVALGLSGAPARTIPAPDDQRIVPGESVGRIRLGMTRAEAVALLGAPADPRGDPLVYRSARGGNRLEIHLADGRVEQIDFTSPAFRTREGIGTASYADERFEARFARWKLRWRFLNVRYNLRSGGLTFYALNADSAHPDYAPAHVGVVHRGSKPPHEALELEDEPDGGWTPWGEDDTYGG